MAFYNDSKMFSLWDVAEFAVSVYVDVEGVELIIASCSSNR